MPSLNNRFSPTRATPVTETVTRTPTIINSSRFTNISKLPTTRERLLSLMSGGKWFDHITIRTVVGPRYSRVMHELRQLGYSFKKKFTQNGVSRVFSYRLVSRGGTRNSN